MYPPGPHPQSILGPAPIILPEPTQHPLPSYNGPPIHPLGHSVPPAGFIPTDLPSLANHQLQNEDPRTHVIQQQQLPQSSPQTNTDAPNKSTSNSTLSCNVQLPSSFDIESLFPEEHPQV